MRLIRQSKLFVDGSSWYEEKCNREVISELCAVGRKPSDV